MSSSSNSPFRRRSGSSGGHGSSSGSGRRGRILPPVFEPGDTIDERYRIIRFLGRGGMGEVYEAEDLDLQVSVALKTVRPEIADHDVALERFRREIQLARKVTHPNVCRIFDVGHHHMEANEIDPEREIVFLTMEHLEGSTLSSRLRKGGPMDESEALPIVEQMAAAIDAAHTAGIVHRDFKSSNVILVDDPGRPGGVRAVVTDFGLARGIQPEDSLTTSLSSSGQAVGTPTYMAPEQVAGSPVTRSVDIYSLGVVVFEMMTGRPPFVSDSPLSTAVKRLIEPPPQPRSLMPGIGSRWESGILRCLEKDPSSRFQEAGDLVRWIRGEPLSSSRTRRPTRRGVGLIALVLLIVVSLAAIAWWRDRAAPASPGSLAPRPLAAVIGFRNLTGSEQSEWLSTALQEMLSMELAASERVRVVSGDTVARTRMELGIHDMAGLSTREVDRIARNLGADLVILGSYFIEEGESDPEIRFDVRVHRRGVEEVVSPVIETGRRSELLRLVSRAGASLRTELGYETAETDTTTALTASYPIDPAATMSYAVGLEALRQGDPIRARKALEKSLEIEQGNPLAHSALSSAWSFLGYDSRAVAAARRAMDLSEGLPREERLLIEGRFYESAAEWERAAETYERLWEIAPDNIEYGLALARAQAGAADPAAFQTLRRIESIAPSSDPRIPLGEAAAAEALGDFELESAAARRAAELSRNMGAWVLLARARLAEWWAERNMGNLEAATAASSEAFDVAKRVGNRSLIARALNAIATTKRQMGQTAEARELDLESLEVFREIGDKRREGWALNNLGLAAYEEGDLDEAIRYFDATRDLAREIDDQAGLSRALGNKGNVLQDMGRLRESETIFREMLAMALENEDRRSLPWARANLAGTLSATGELDQARRLLAEARQGFASNRERRGEGWALIRTGELEIYQSQPEKAERTLLDALTLFRDIGDQRGTYWAEMRLAEALLEQNEEEAALALLSDARTLQQSVNARFGEAMNLTISSRAALDLGEARRAQDLASQAAAIFGSLGVPDRRAEALIALARAQLDDGKTAAARRTIDSARRTIAHGDDERLNLRLEITAREIEARSGDGRSALDGLRLAKESATRLGYLDLAGTVDDRIASLDS